MEAIKTFAPGKACGLDGIPMEVYLTFFDEIKKYLLACFNYSFTKGVLSDSQKQGVISLLLKQQSDGQYKDPTHMENWRPLTLLCCDTRILSKCIALRLKNVIGSIIKHEQVGFIKGRFIGENIRQVIDIIEEYDKIQKPGILFISDFEKAFDKISWKFIYSTLKFFNFGQDILRWAHILYNQPCSTILNNGYLSQTFPLSRGVRQGCPLSPYLFIMGMEILATRIRRNTLIKGLILDNNEIKLTMYADDVTFFLQPEEQTLRELINELNLFSNISGLKPNFEKCAILRLGIIAGTNFALNCPVPVKWTNSDIQVLGIHINGDIKSIVDLNYERKLKKVESILLPWRGTHLSIIGKVTLINSLIIPQFIYLLSSLPSPGKPFFKLFEKRIFKFIWDDKPDKIKRQYMYNSFENGGLNLKSLEILNESLKASWISKIYHNPEWMTSQRLSNTYTFFHSKLYPFFQLKSQHVDQILKKELGGISIFFKDALKAWLNFQYYPPDGFHEVQNQIIWMNSNILIDGQPILWDNCFKSCVVFINDLMDNSGDFLSFSQFCVKYGHCIDHLQYNQLMSAIPMKWKRVLQNKDRLFVCMPKIRCDRWLVTKINKKVYKFYLCNTGKTFYPHRLCTVWEDEFNTPILWRHYFRNIYNTTIDSYSRIFQIKTFYKIIATRKHLAICNFITCSLCRFCDDEDEDLMHLFYFCPFVALFWTSVQKWLKEFKIEIDICPMNIILGSLESNSKEVENTIIVVAKIFIFKCKSKADLCLAYFKNKLHQQFVIERVIAININKETSHDKKWKALGWN